METFVKVVGYLFIDLLAMVISMLCALSWVLNWGYDIQITLSVMCIFVCIAVFGLLLYAVF